MVPGDGFEPPTRGFSIRAKSKENQEGSVSKHPRTDRELNENVSNVDLNRAKENPGALAGATGAEIESFWSWFDTNVKRQADASRVVDAVLSCGPEDRILFLETILDNLRPGFPRVLRIDAMRECRGYAADLLPTYRKAMCLACYEAMPACDRVAFLGHVDRRAAA